MELKQLICVLAKLFSAINCTCKELIIISFIKAKIYQVGLLLSQGLNIIQHKTKREVQDKKYNEHATKNST